MESVRAALQKRPMIPALKAVVAHYAADDGWRRLRPPLEVLDTNVADEIVRELDAIQFEMPGIRAVAGALVD
jgi:4-hydroxy-tetrahydrodipicolinate synthase